MDARDDLFARSEHLDERLKELPIDVLVAKLVTSGRRNRHLIRLVALGLMLDIALTGAAFGGYLAIRRVANTTARNAATLSQLCEAGNEFRRENRALWQPVLNESKRAPADPRLSPAGRQRQERLAQDFQKRLNNTFASRPCPNPR